MLNNRIYHRKCQSRTTLESLARANAAKLAIGDRVKHAFADRMSRPGFFIRTIGIVFAQAKLSLANLAYNFKRLIFL